MESRNKKLVASAILAVLAIGNCKSEESQDLSAVILAALGSTEQATTTTTTPTDPRTYKYTFLTSTSYDGNLGGVSGADTKCNNDANKPSDGGTFKAFVSTDTRKSDGTDWVFASNQEYRYEDGTVVGTTNSLKIFETLSSGLCTSASTEAWTGGVYWNVADGSWTEPLKLETKIS